MSEYKRVLFEWAKEWLESNAIVTDVSFVHHEGYYYSELTFELAYDEIVIEYTVDGIYAVRTLDPDDVPFNKLITDLFNIASKEDND